MRQALLLLAVGGLVMLAAGCLGGSSGGSDRSAAAHRPSTRVEVTYSAGFRRQCRDHVVGRCIPVRLRSTTCPATARCVAPVPSAQLIQCPGQGRPGQHCFAVTREPDGAVLLLQQRELECSPAPHGGYADPAAACRALAQYLRVVDVHAKRRLLCSCAVTVWPATLVGVVAGRGVSVGLGGCCLPAKAAAAGAALTPPLGA